MSVNKYFQNGKKGIGERSTQNVIENLIEQAIKVAGYDLIYLPRQLNNFDKLFGEDTLSSFEAAYPIEMYLEQSSDYNGGNDMMSKFGLQFNDTVTFVCSKRRWDEAIGRTGSTIIPRPCEGDIIYSGLTKSYFEIKFVDGLSNKFQIGKNYVWKFNCELFQYSSEKIDTGVSFIDDIKFPFSEMAEEQFVMFTDEGGELVDESGFDIVSEDFNMDVVDPQADNETIRHLNDGLLRFDLNNPFGNIVS